MGWRTIEESNAELARELAREQARKARNEALEEAAKLADYYDFIVVIPGPEGMGAETRFSFLIRDLKK